MLKMKRAYEKPAEDDGARVLVDRLWPRGVKKEDAHIDWWAKDLAPSTELREWFGHDPDKWPEFRRRYFSELDARPLVVQRIAALAKEGPVTLLYASRDRERNQAVALRDYLEGLCNGT